MVIRTMDPVRARELLGEKLRQLREERGISQQVAAERLARARSWLSRVEDGKTRSTPGEVEVLLGFYRASTAQASELIQLAAQAGPSRSSSAYRPFRDVIDDDLDPLLRAELQADSICSFEDTAIPGQVQIREYAELIIGAGVQRVSEEEIRKRVDLRMSRQKIRSKPNPPRVTCIIGEGALRQMVGGPEVMAKQLDHLIDLAESGDVDIRVLGFEAGAHPAFNGAFLLITMPPLPAFAADGPEVVAYQDTTLGCVYHREAEEVGVYQLIWKELLEKALSAKESLERLNTIRNLINQTS